MSKIESARKLIEEKKRLLAMKIEQVRTRQQSEEKKKKALQAVQARVRKEPEKWAQSRTPPKIDAKKWPQKETAPEIEEIVQQPVPEAKSQEDDLNKSLQTAKFVPPIEDLDSDRSIDSSSSSSSIVQHVSDINEDPGESFHRKEGRTPPAAAVISPPPMRNEIPESSSSGSPPEEPEEEVEIDPKTVTFQLQPPTEEEKVSDTGQRLKFEVESQIRMIKKTIQKSVFLIQTDDREAQKTQIKQDLLKALLKSKSAPVEEAESAQMGEGELIPSDEEVVMRPTIKEEAAVTFGKPLNLGRGAETAEDDVSMVNLEGKKGVERGRYSEEEEEIEIKPEPRRGEMSEVEMFKPRREVRRQETEKPLRQVKMRPSQSPRPGTRSPETEEAKEKQVDEAKYRRHKNLPKLVFNKPSNRKLIKNAIVQVCLAGEAYKLQREEVLRVIDENAEACNFIIVFRGELGRQDLKALYELDAGTEQVNKLYGPAIWPETIDSGQVQSYYRYDSGAKEFRQLQCRTFSIATDAVVLKTAQKTGKNALY